MRPSIHKPDNPLRKLCLECWVEYFLVFIDQADDGFCSDECRVKNGLAPQEKS
jgi:hypothetical protein